MSSTSGAWSFWVVDMMKFKAFRMIPVLLVLLLLSSACAGFPLDFLATPTPVQTSTPQVIFVVVTPTPSPQRISSAEDFEAQRIAVYEQAAPAVVNITTQVLRTSFFWGTVPEEGSGSGFSLGYRRSISSQITMWWRALSKLPSPSAAMQACRHGWLAPIRSTIWR